MSCNVHQSQKVCRICAGFICSLLRVAINHLTCHNFFYLWYIPIMYMFCRGQHPFFPFPRIFTFVRMQPVNLLTSSNTLKVPLLPPVGTPTLATSHALSSLTSPSFHHFPLTPPILRVKAPSLNVTSISVLFSLPTGEHLYLLTCSSTRVLMDNDT